MTSDQAAHRARLGPDVIPAKAGIQVRSGEGLGCSVDPRVRRDQLSFESSDALDSRFRAEATKQN